MTLDALIDRDGGSCVWCSRTPWRSDLSAEHLLPRSKRGRRVPENLSVACRACNIRRKSRPVAAYVRAQMQAGQHPRLDLIRRGLERLSCSEASGHAEYALRQLDLLDRESFGDS